MKRLPKMKLPLLSVLAALVLLLLVGLAPSPGHATVYTLTSDNSTVNVDPSSQSGISNWVVDGYGYNLYQEWFWYRVGTAGATNVAKSFDTLTLTSAVLSPDGDHLDLSYLGTGFNINIGLNLKGAQAGSLVSDLAEQITVNNTSGAVLNFHLFEYTDFDLNNSVGDKAMVVNQFVVDQYSGIARLSETVVGPKADRWEIDNYANTLGRLNGNANYNLNNSPNIGVEAGPGDMTWAFQWDRDIPSGGALSISKDKNLIVPLPPSALLLGSGLLGLGLLGYRRKSKV